MTRYDWVLLLDDVAYDPLSGLMQEVIAKNADNSNIDWWEDELNELNGLIDDSYEIINYFLISICVSNHI